MAKRAKKAKKSARVGEVPIKFCTECFIAMPSAMKHCPNCGRYQWSRKELEELA